jgi:hypothetical protein
MVRPTNNLPPESQPWARSIEQSLDEASFAAIRGQENTDNSLVAINGTLNQLSRQVAELNTLTTQLAAQQAQINTTIDNLISATNYSAIQNGYGLSTSDTDFCAGTVTIPAGYSKAAVILVTVASAWNNRASMDYLYLAARINGVKSREIPTMVLATSNADVTTASSTYLTGLAGGSTITLACSAHAQGGAWAFDAANRISVEALVIFFK